MRKTLAGLIIATSLVSMAACSSTATPSPTGSATSTAPEDVRTSATAVAVGLKAINALSAKIATSSATQGKILSKGIEPIWVKIEGTVKANDPDAYLAFEDAFAKLESGDTTQAAAGAATVASTTTAYLAKYPAA
jgi:hypothetical protein